MKGGDAQESLRTRGIPDLCFDTLVAVRQRTYLEFKLNTVCCLWIFIKDILRNPQKSI